MQGTVIDRFKSVCLTTDEHGAVRIRSFSDGGHLTSRVAAEAVRDEHRLSLDVIHRVRHVRTSCTTIPEEDIVSAQVRADIYTQLGIDWKFYKILFLIFIILPQHVATE